MKTDCKKCIHVHEVTFSNARHSWGDIFCKKGYWAGEAMIRPVNCKDFKSKFDIFIDELEENLNPSK